MDIPRKIHLIILFCLISSGVRAQETWSISGYIGDYDSGEKLSGASIFVDGLNTQAMSNEYGFYALSLPAGTHEVRFSFTGYKSHAIQVYLVSDTSISVELQSRNTLKEVVIEAVQEPDLHEPVMGLNSLSVEELKRIPVIFGEKDVLKTIQLLPGVLSGGEGNSGFYVRGGTMDQNLILLDEATVFNAAHLFGFFSTFNTDAIKDIELYKGGMPAQYGGRLSSVLDVHTRDGNKKEYEWQGGIGLIASRLSFEGPIVPGKGSFILSGRRTYADMFLKLSSDSAVRNSLLYFYDLNAKADYQLDEKNRIFLSGYMGRDELGYSDVFRFGWGNATGTFRWNHVYNHRLFSNTSMIFSDYRYKVDIMEETNNFDIAASIQSLNLKQDFQYFLNPAHNLRFGLNAMYHKIKPASIDATADAQVADVYSEARHGAELSLYFSDHWKVSESFSMEYGVRITSFQALGPGHFHNYDSEGDVTGTAVLGTGEIAASYWSLEPRFSASYKATERSSFKVSYNRNVQNLHLLSNSSSALPIDVWIMSSNNVRPQAVNQAAVGYYYEFGDKTYNLTVESYYKALDNQIDLKNGADIQANPTVEGDMAFGRGRAYGLEFLVKKQRGDLTGWLSYTLSKSERKFSAINSGRWFNAKQDRTHDFALVGMYRFNNHWSLSSTFVFSTGNAVTFPSGKYYLEDHPVWYYSARNEYRMPDYHRLDLGVSWTPGENRKFRSSWEFGVYNVYNRKNAYLIDFRSNEQNPRKTEAYQISLFGIIPSVTWNFKF